MAMDKGKAIDRSPPAPVITLEALCVLLDAIQALTLVPPVALAPTASADGIFSAGGAHVAPIHNRFHCSACGAYNVGQSMSAWYVITAGRQVSISSSWSLVQPHITGVVHACYCRYSNRQAAQQVYNDAMTAGLVHVLP
ncbi:hypothetical protein ARMGADRAFT_1021800 [Armillaria gallica]|uniref:Ribonuclease H1 N-terminal domain-containing protein n=1 Tax=Armillaria gallica TaxID=47427 RepID=A0A2H3EU40_ARMGA|nr:hypothetical protein ARMGADRAFT_1021800 [Armillaria gallica]